MMCPDCESLAVVDITTMDDAALVFSCCRCGHQGSNEHYQQPIAQESEPESKPGLLARMLNKFRR